MTNSKLKVFTNKFQEDKSETKNPKAKIICKNEF